MRNTLVKAYSLRRLTLALLFLTAVSAGAASNAVKQLTLWETQSNAVSQRSSEALQIEHYEIPLDAVEVDFAKQFSSDIYKALVFDKDGKKWVRWIINPEDTDYHQSVWEFLFGKVKGIPQKHHYFTGYLTASRSLIIEDPVSGAQFSAKVSTNWTGGDWKDKKQTFTDAKWIRMADEYLRERTQKLNPEHFRFLQEPAIVGIPSLDQAMVIRTLGDLPQDGHYYLPGFSAVHETEGRKIAQMNGSENPSEYWNEHYNKPLARAKAELAAHYGLTFDSPHSQNFLIELDKNMKPTGKIIFRDLADTYVQKQFFETIGRSDFIRSWNQAGVKDGELKVGMGLLMGNHPPSWLNENIYKKWTVDFFKEFESEFSKKTGISSQELEKTPFSHPPDGKNNYLGKIYKTNSEAWGRYFKAQAHSSAAFQCIEQTIRKTGSSKSAD